MKHINITVEGKVQGVFYRKNTEQKANELGLKGFVQNEPNGNVYIEVEGEEHLIFDFIKWCNSGPERSNVTALKITKGAVLGFSSFEIRR